MPGLAKMGNSGLDGQKSHDHEAEAKTKRSTQRDLSMPRKSEIIKKDTFKIQAPRFSKKETFQIQPPGYSGTPSRRKRVHSEFASKSDLTPTATVIAVLDDEIMTPDELDIVPRAEAHLQPDKQIFDQLQSNRKLSTPREQVSGQLQSNRKFSSPREQASGQLQLGRKLRPPRKEAGVHVQDGDAAIASAKVEPSSSSDKVPEFILSSSLPGDSDQINTEAKEALQSENKTSGVLSESGKDNSVVADLKRKSDKAAELLSPSASPTASDNIKTKAQARQRRSSTRTESDDIKAKALARQRRQSMKRRGSVHVEVHSVLESYYKVMIFADSFIYLYKCDYTPFTETYLYTNVHHSYIYISIFRVLYKAAIL